MADSSTRKSHRFGINLAVAQTLDRARRDADYTYEALAARLPMSLRSLQRKLSGEASIDVEDLADICDALGLTPAQVVAAAQAGMEAEARSSDRDLADRFEAELRGRVAGDRESSAGTRDKQPRAGTGST